MGFKYRQTVVKMGLKQSSGTQKNVFIIFQKMFQKSVPKNVPKNVLYIVKGKHALNL